MLRLSRHPVVGIALSVVFFIVLDAAIFRSGFYARFVSPESTAGKFFYSVYYERGRQADPKRDVLLLGNSKMEWGFGAKHWEEFAPESPIHFIQGATSASDEEWWYYMLRALDPNHDRYAAIVIPITAYRIAPWSTDFQNRDDTAEVLAPILRLADWPGFVGEFSRPELRSRATVLALSGARRYALDLQDFLLHPLKRVEELRRRAEIGQNWLRDFTGATGTMDELRVDPATGRVAAYPARFPEFKRRETDTEFIRPPASDAPRLTARNAAFEAEWIARIVKAYDGSKTRLIFIQVPRFPVPTPSHTPIDNAPDVRDMIPRAPNVTVLSPDEFTFLEQPRYFTDILHLNSDGLKLFTEKLGTEVERVMAGN